MKDLSPFCFLTLAGKTVTGTFPNFITTTTIVAHNNMNTDVSTYDYVNITLQRNETNGSDTCSTGDISVS
jgi:hypothetical protein